MEFSSQFCDDTTEYYNTRAKQRYKKTIFYFSFPYASVLHEQTKQVQRFPVKFSSFQWHLWLGKCDSHQH